MRIETKTVTADKIYPLAGVFDEIALSKRGALTVGWELTLPTETSLTEDEYDGMIETFARAIRPLPAYTIVHRQDLYLKKKYEDTEEPAGFLEESYNNHFKGREYFIHKAYIFLTLSNKNAIQKGGKSSGIFGIRGSVDIPSTSVFREWQSKCKEFISILTTGGIISARQLYESDWLGDEKTVGIVQRYMMLGNDSPVMSEIELSGETVGAYDKKAVCYAIGDSDLLPGVIPSVSVIGKYSSNANEVFLSFGSQLGLQLKCEHVVNSYIVVPFQDEIFKEREKEMKKMGGSPSSDNRLNANEISVFLDEAYAQGKFAIRASHNIIAWGTESELFDIRGDISSALGSMKITASYCKHNTPVIWYAGMPSAEMDLGIENLMTMELSSALCLMNYETFYQDTPGGVMRICDRTRNIPIRIDFQKLAREKGLIAAYNAFILGASGTGKSFFTNTLVNNLYNRGESVFIIDVGDSYEGLCRVINEESGGRDGQYHTWDSTHPFAFNPFVGFNEWITESGSLKQDENGVNFIMSFLQTVWEPADGWTSDRVPILRQTIQDFIIKMNSDGIHSDENLPILDDYYRYLSTEVASKLREGIYDCGGVLVREDRFSITDFLLALKAYSADGEFGFLMNEKHPKDIFSSRFVVFEVDALSNIEDKKFYSLCILCIMNAFDHKMRSASGFKSIIIEEAWKAIANETMAPYLAGLWKTARKFSTSACVVTQEIEDIIKSEIIKTAILDNSDIKILLDQSNHLNSFGKLETILSLTPKDRNLILSMNRANNPNYRYKEVFISIGGKVKGVFATEVSPQEAMAFESEKEKKRPLLTLADETGSIVKAISQLTSK